MRVLPLIVLYVWSYVAAQNLVCAPAETCVSTVGASCDYNSSYNGVCVGADNLYCNYTSSTSTCQRISNVGEPCAQYSEQCGQHLCLGYGTTDVTFVCSTAYSRPGDSCVNDTQCIFTNANGASNSTCVNGQCYGLSQGEQCTDPFYQCGSGLFCDFFSSPFNFTCQPLLSLGAECIDSLQCTRDAGFGLVSCLNISKTTSQCGKLLTGTTGDYCVADSLFCQDSFYCSLDNECQPAFTASNKSCSTNSDCSSNEECACFGLSTTCQVPNGGANPAGISKALTDLWACFENHPECSQFDCNTCDSQQCELYNVYQAAGYDFVDCGSSAAEIALAAKCKASLTTSAAVPAVHQSLAYTVLLIYMFSLAVVAL